MKTNLLKIQVLAFVIGVSGIAIPFASAQNSLDKENAARLQSLINASNIVRSIDPSDINFNDLKFLKSKIGNSRLVILGEDSHGDGETDKAKIRVIKFLHEQMGFDVIAWEFNFSLDGYMNPALQKDPSNLIPNQYYGFGWDSNESLSELMSYSKKSLGTTHPIIHAGFDFDRPPAGPYIQAFLSRLGEFDPSLKMSESEKLAVDSLSGSIHGFLGNVYKKSFSKTGYTMAVNCVNALKNNLKKNRQQILKKIGHETFTNDSLLMESLTMDIELASLSPAQEEWNSKRDEYMAKRISWLLNIKHPGKKVIIWAATAHLIRNNTTIKRFDEKGVASENKYKQAGYYVANTPGLDLYTIAFTSYSGVTGTITQKGDKYLDTLTKPLMNSYEELAHRSGKKYVFTDLKYAPQNNWLSGEFTAYPLGYNKDVARWKNVVDALFFIDEMKPVVQRSLKK